MEYRVAGRTAFITGGASGIGLGLARALLAAGARVVIADVNGAALDAAIADLDGGADVHAVQLDVRDRAQWQATKTQAEDRLGPVTLLVNNAGVIGYDPIIDTPPDYFQWVVDVNLMGMFNGIHVFGRPMVDRGLGGHIVNTASISGLYGAESLTLGAYCASKFGAVGLSERLRAELAPLGVGVSTLCPGMVTTRLGANVHHLKPVDEGVRLADNPVFANLRADRPAAALHPDRLGPYIVQGIEENRAYILPHPHYAELIEERHQRIMADFGAAADPTVAIAPNWRNLA